MCSHHQIQAHLSCHKCLSQGTLSHQRKVLKIYEVSPDLYILRSRGYIKHKTRLYWLYLGSWTTCGHEFIQIMNTKVTHAAHWRLIGCFFSSMQMLNGDLQSCFCQIIRGDRQRHQQGNSLGRRGETSHFQGQNFTRLLSSLLYQREMMSYFLAVLFLTSLCCAIKTHCALSWKCCKITVKESMLNIIEFWYRRHTVTMNS